MHTPAPSQWRPLLRTFCSTLIYIMSLFNRSLTLSPSVCWRINRFFEQQSLSWPDDFTTQSNCMLSSGTFNWNVVLALALLIGAAPPIKRRASGIDIFYGFMNIQGLFFLKPFCYGEIQIIWCSIILQIFPIQKFHEASWLVISNQYLQHGVCSLPDPCLDSVAKYWYAFWRSSQREETDPKEKGGAFGSFCSFTSQKLNIDTKNGHVYNKESPFPNHHFGYPS